MHLEPALFGPVAPSPAPSDVDSLTVEKRSQGQIRTHERKDGLTTYSLRVRAYGRREVVTLGTDADGWTCRNAERALGPDPR